MEIIDLKAFRKANNISQVQLAEYLGVVQSFISQVEKGVRPIPKEFISKITANQDWDTSMLISASKPIELDVMDHMFKGPLLDLVEKANKANEMLLSMLQAKDEYIKNVTELLLEAQAEISSLREEINQLKMKGATVGSVDSSSVANAG
jgi:transcriptional regulator with XRE-family HTH domain